jgi:hypothetical protein
MVIAAADRNPDKWGLMTPGTHIPIISEELMRDQNKFDQNGVYLLALPWHFRSEFIKREQDFLNRGGKFIFPLPKFDIVGRVKDEE